MRFKDTLKGMPVVGAGGRLIGEIYDFVIDRSTWCVTDVVIRVGSEAVAALGIKQPFWSRAQLTISITRISEVNEVAFLTGTLDELAEMIGGATVDP